MPTLSSEKEPVVNTGEDLSSRVVEAFRSPTDHVLRKYDYSLRGSSMSKYDHKFYSHYRTGHSIVVRPDGYWMHMQEGASDIPRVHSGCDAAEMNRCLKAIHPEAQYLRADDLLRRAEFAQDFPKAFGNNNVFVRPI